jgi:hypothetical protein
VRLAEYTPAGFDSLRAAAERLRVRSLCHRPFVDYYYTGNPWCCLYLLRQDGGAIAGTLGIDRMQFAAGKQLRTLAFATNYHAAQPGAGGYLYLHWLKSSDVGLVFGGSADTHKIIRQQRWTYFPGVKTYVLNRPYRPSPRESLWRRWAKVILANVPRASVAARALLLPGEVVERISVEEEGCLTEDMLPATSPFSFRFAPSLEYANWRYRTGLSFVHYRVFRVRTVGRTSGYVILNESPEKVIVAHCDGEEPAAVAYGVLLSLQAVMGRDTRVREVVLTSSHPEMQRVYRRFGFRASRTDGSLAVGSRRGPVDLPADTSHWLVNFDWGDNGLRAPFLDQVIADTDGAPARLVMTHG